MPCHATVGEDTETLGSWSLQDSKHSRIVLETLPSCPIDSYGGEGGCRIPGILLTTTEVQSEFNTSTPRHPSIHPSIHPRTTRQAEHQTVNLTCPRLLVGCSTATCTMAWAAKSTGVTSICHDTPSPSGTHPSSRHPCPPVGRYIHREAHRVHKENLLGWGRVQERTSKTNEINYPFRICSSQPINIREHTVPWGVSSTYVYTIGQHRTATLAFDGENAFTHGGGWRLYIAQLKRAPVSWDQKAPFHYFSNAIIFIIIITIMRLLFRPKHHTTCLSACRLPHHPADT